MKPLKLIAAIVAVIATYVFGSTAIAQFEHFQEAGQTFLSPFHEINIIALVAATVASLALAFNAVISIDEYIDESPIPIGDYLRSVLFGTFGAVALGLGIYEIALREGRALPSHMGHAYHVVNIAIIIAIGLALIGVALYYLFRGLYCSRKNSNAVLKKPTGPMTSQLTVLRQRLVTMADRALIALAYTH